MSALKILGMEFCNARLAIVRPVWWRTNDEVYMDHWVEGKTGSRMVIVRDSMAIAEVYYSEGVNSYRIHMPSVLVKVIPESNEE